MSVVVRARFFTGAVCLTTQVAEDFCLTIVGNLITPGAKLGLALEQNEEKQYWKIQPDGRIYSKMKPNLVLDIKGKNILVGIPEFL